MNDSQIRLSASTLSPGEIDADWLLAAIPENGAPSPALAVLDAKLGGIVSMLRERGDFAGKAGELLALHAPAGIKAKRLLLIGIGKLEQASRRTLHDVAAAALKSITGKKLARVALVIPDAAGVTLEQRVLAFGVGAIQGSHGPGIKKTEPSRHPPNEMVLAVPAGSNIDAALRRAAIEGDALTLARSLVNAPPCELYPETFASKAEDIARRLAIDCDIWDEHRLATEGMGAILGIAQGSTRPARLAILRYRGGGDKTLAYVGKGVTFDSGGLSLKTNEQMLDMKCDMAGAAAVLASLQAIAELKLKVNILAVMPLVENMPSGYSVKLYANVLKSLGSCKTIEILNTDAEETPHSGRRSRLRRRTEGRSHRRFGHAHRRRDDRAGNRNCGPDEQRRRLGQPSPLRYRPSR